MTAVVDLNGAALAVGTPVRCGLSVGTVTEISDPDGDTDDYGRVIGINPRVTVEFDDGEDVFTTSLYEYDGPFRCDDVEVVS